MLALYDCSVDVLGATPDLPFPMSRGEEIQCWLNAHPGVEHYVILDDFDPKQMALPTEQSRSRHVHVNEESGMTDEDANKAISLLTPNR